MKVEINDRLLEVIKHTADLASFVPGFDEDQNQINRTFDVSDTIYQLILLGESRLVATIGMIVQSGMFGPDFDNESVEAFLAKIQEAMAKLSEDALAGGASVQHPENYKPIKEVL